MKFSIERTARTRILFFAAADIIFIVLSVFLAFLLRFDATLPQEYIDGGVFQSMTVLALIFCLPVFYFLGLYSFSWTFVSVTELISLVKATTLSFIFVSVSIFVLKTFQGFPRSTLFIAFFLIFVFCGGMRFAKRIYLEVFKVKEITKEKALIVGAGEAGESILRSILAAKETPYRPIGFIDDSDVKRGVSIRGLKVLGRLDDIPKLIKKYEIQNLIIALPSAGSQAIKKSVELGRKAGLKKIKVMPTMGEIIGGEVSLRSLREVQVEDLLKREPIELELEPIKRFVENKKVLITGAAGSIGSELSRQVAKFNPSLLLILDQDETGIFNISGEIKSRYPKITTKPLIADIRDREKINQIFEESKPDIIFHAAAYKHVPLMENQPAEAVKNNVFGTKNIAEAALKNGADKFIFISTDKAVNPTSVMGATKRVGEMICQNLNQKNGTKFVSVRFGNVLDSRGSVIPIFKEQIRKGGPVEVTHPEMKRYFMMIPEAVLLVLQAAEMGQGGEVFVLDMGHMVKIVDLAKEMIRLSGFEPDKDIPIVFTGTRPGEKLYEEILTAEEGTAATQNKKIFKANLSRVDEKELEKSLDEIKRTALDGDKKEIIGKLKRIVPLYK